MDSKKESNSEFEQTASGIIAAGLKREDTIVKAADEDILRGLASEVAEIASSQRMEQVRKHWKQLNSLEDTQPIVFCDPENGWNEIITSDQIQCDGTLARRWEMNLRKEIFWGREMGDDKPVEPYFDVPYTAEPDDWGLHTEFHKTDAKGSMNWDAPFRSYDTDLDKVAFQGVKIDLETTEASLGAAHNVFDGILDVRLKTDWWWTLGLTMQVVYLRGLENLMFDFFDNPDGLHELMKRLSNGIMEKLDYLEEHNLLSLNNDGTYVGSGGYGFTDQLPGIDFKGDVRCQDMWGFAESQETVGVSSEMYEEFIFPYEEPILKRFGLNCYGCCEPLDSRWEVVKKHPNLRRISCSPWADYEKMAEYLGNQYIFSMKVNPADVATSGICHDKIRKELRRNLEITKGCVVEIIMKDNHTIGNRPSNVTEWCKIAKEEARGISGQ